MVRSFDQGIALPRSAEAKRQPATGRAWSSHSPNNMETACAGRPECDGTAGEKKKRSAVSGGGTIRLSGTFGDMGGEGNDRRFGMDRTGRKRHRRCLRRHR